MTSADLARVRGRRPPRQLERDTEATAFTALLSELISRIPGARAAALVDSDGESVDYAGALSPFDVKVAAAHLQLVLSDIGRLRPLGAPQRVVIRGAKKSFIVRALADAYAVVVVLSARAGFAASSRAFVVFERALRAEAGIGKGSHGSAWTPVLVRGDARARPQTIATANDARPQAVEVLGAVMGLSAGERGYRVRFATGLETTVVREPGGVWYAEELIEQGSAARA
jgi:predicted regulator of Ras-like GTPase activity (Roadblock/LC7/MglB family)